MSWFTPIQRITNDPVRLAQWFMMCRHAGILLSSIVIARSLPLAQIGIFEMLMLSGYLVTFVWSEAMIKGYLATPSAKSDTSAASGFIWLYLLIGIIVLSTLVAGEKLFIPLFTGRPSLEGLALFAIYQMLVIIIWVAPFTGLLNSRQYHLISIYVLAGPALASWIGYRIRPDLSGILFGMIGYALLGFIGVMTKVGFFHFRKIKTLINTLWPVTWPLMMYAVSTGLARSFDSWLVSRAFDEIQFAIFRYGAREFPLVVAVAAGLSTVMIPKLLKKDALPELRIRSSRLMHLCYPAIALLMLCSPLLFEWFFGSAFIPGAYIFNIYLLLTLTQLIFPQTILTARGDTKLMWYISIAELGVNIIASLILLSYFGLPGIAMGTLIAFAFEKVVLLYFVRKRHSVRLFQMFNPYLWLGYAALLLIAFNVAKWIS